jgi:hypothetical protein
LSDGIRFQEPAVAALAEPSSPGVMAGPELRPIPDNGIAADFSWGSVRKYEELYRQLVGWAARFRIPPQTGRALPGLKLEGG